MFLTESVASDHILNCRPTEY